MLEDGDRKCVCQRWGAISSNYSAARDNLAHGDDANIRNGRVIDAVKIIITSVASRP